MSCCLGPSVVRLESYINENSKGSFYLKNVTLQLGCSFVIFEHKTLGEIQSQILFFFFSPTNKIPVSCYLRQSQNNWNEWHVSKPMCWWTMKLQLFKGSTEHGLCPNWLGVQTRMPRFKVRADINEGNRFLKVFCWLCCLSNWGVGPFKRGSHLSVQGQQSWSGEPHCASLITKNLRRFRA